MINREALFLLLAASQGILLSLALIFSGIKNNKPNIFLGLALFVISLVLLSAWGMQSGYLNQHDAIPFWLLESYLILPPSLYLYIKLNSNRKISNSFIYFFLFVPAVFEILVESYCLFLFRMNGTFINLLENSFWFIFTEIAPIFWVLIVLFYYWKILRELSVQNVGSVKTGIYAPVFKLSIIFYTFFFITILWFLEVVFEMQIFHITQIILVGFLFALAYIGYFKPDFLHKAPVFLKNANDLFINYDDTKELKKLNQLFDLSKIYLKPRLSVEDVANEIKLPQRYVSYLINNYYNTNFNNFVNSYRVKEVLSKINDPKEKHKTLLGIALESGFTSKSSFNQIFKTHTGQPPSCFLSESTK